MTFLPKKDLLSLEELDRLCSAFIRLGVRKLRITGGEPLVRRNIMSFFQNIGRHLETGALDELTVTTNGSQLTRFAQQLYDSGVRRVNVSLDTLNEDKFASVTRWGRLPGVLRGIDTALSIGLKIKLNLVALKGFNEDELPQILEFCNQRGMDVTFIEVMPMGDMGETDRIGQFWSLQDVESQIAQHHTMTPLPDQTGGPARYVQLDTGQRVGFITPLSHNFCESCNRVRVTCTGEIYTCLGQEGKSDLRAALRSSEGDHILEKAIRNAITLKPKGHDFDYSRGTVEGQMSRHMSHTGG